MCWAGRSPAGFLGSQQIPPHPLAVEVVALLSVAVGGLSLPTTYLLRHLHTRRLLRSGYTSDEVALLLRAQRVPLVLRRDE